MYAHQCTCDMLQWHLECLEYLCVFEWKFERRVRKTAWSITEYFTGMMEDVIDRLVKSPNSEHEPLTNFINNEFVPSNDVMPSENPATGQAWIEIPDSTAEDVHRAVEAAKRAFPSWSTTSVQYRSGLLLKLADIIEQNADGLAVLESRDQGKPIKLAKMIDIPRCVHNFRFFATAILHHTSPSSVIDEPVRAVNYVRNDPVGVAGLISPWNLPLYLLSFKLAPALGTGNTVVCKPSELTSVTAWVLMHAFRQAGFPPGVVNLVIGKGSPAGQALVEHPDVNLISFTGSTVTGKKLAEICARLNKKVSLEMGGKNAAIIYPSCNLGEHLPTIARSCFINQGEICLCSSNIFVHKAVYKDFVARLVEEAKKFTVGDPAKDVTLGAMNSKAHFDKVKSYISLAEKEGGTVHCGGEVNMDGHLKEGYYIAPTVITDVGDSSRCMQEEIFGPVVCITEFESTEVFYCVHFGAILMEPRRGPVMRVTFEEVLSRANATTYGLSATVWSENNKELINTAHGLRVGTVWCNAWLVRDLNMPFGGTKESGMGREGAVDSLHFFTEQKTVCIRL
ncbi:aldehyde dehydrogenase family protein [Cooperia oncophora]